MVRNRRSAEGTGKRSIADVVGAANDRTIRKGMSINENMLANVIWKTIADRQGKLHSHGSCLQHQPAKKNSSGLIVCPEMTTLVVFVDNSHFVADLDMNKAIFMARVEFLLKKEPLYKDLRIDDIKFVVHQEVGRKKEAEVKEEKKKEEESWELMALTDKEIEDIDKEVSEISNEKLRETVRSAFIVSLEAKKGQEASKTP